MFCIWLFLILFWKTLYILVSYWKLSLFNLWNSSFFMSSSKVLSVVSIWSWKCAGLLLMRCSCIAFGVVLQETSSSLFYSENGPTYFLLSSNCSPIWLTAASLVNFYCLFLCTRFLSHWTLFASVSILGAIGLSDPHIDTFYINELFPSPPRLFFYYYGEKRWIF